ncbi:hypothetical protein SOPP22_09665 [Shewanella sp. OPT22]|nr:hypothetical protein SOPP22_09665 [Shewanella sp. OPT22]
MMAAINPNNLCLQEEVSHQLWTSYDKPVIYLGERKYEYQAMSTSEKIFNPRAKWKVIPFHNEQGTQRACQIDDSKEAKREAKLITYILKQENIEPYEGTLTFESFDQGVKLEYSNPLFSGESSNLETEKKDALDTFTKVEVNEAMRNISPAYSNLSYFLKCNSERIHASALVEHMYSSIPVAERSITFPNSFFNPHKCPFTKEQLTAENAIQINLKQLYPISSSEADIGWITVSRAGVRRYLKDGAKAFPKLATCYESRSLTTNDLREVSAKNYDPSKKPDLFFASGMNVAM